MTSMPSRRDRVSFVLRTGVLPALTTWRGPPDRVRGVEGQDLADDEPVEEHPGGGEVLLDGRGRARQLFDVGRGHHQKHRTVRSEGEKSASVAARRAGWGRSTVGCRGGYLPPGRVEISPCGGCSCVDLSAIVPWRRLDAVFSRSRFLDGEEPVLEVRVSVLHVGLQPRGEPHVERRGYLPNGWGWDLAVWAIHARRLKRPRLPTIRISPWGGSGTSGWT